MEFIVIFPTSILIRDIFTLKMVFRIVIELNHLCLIIDETLRFVFHEVRTQFLLYSHYQACGGGHSSIGWHTCTSLTRGRWVTSHNFTFSERWGHTSWHTSRGTYLMGGGIFAQESVLVQAGGLANYSFHMKNNTK